MRTPPLLLRSTMTLAAAVLLGAGLVAGASGAVDAYGIYFFKDEHGKYGWAGADYGVHGKGVIRAIDYQTGQIRWNHEIGGGSNAGMLTTDAGVTFTGDSSGNALALRTSDGSTLWHAAIGGVSNSPVTVELDGRQYVLLAGGGALYAWRLPL